MMGLIACIFANCKTKQLMHVKSESTSTPDSSWANLPPDLLHSITERLDGTDCTRISAVCTSWASTVGPYLRSFAPFRLNLNHSIPLLLLSAKDSETNPNCTDLTFYDLTSATSYSIPISIPSLHDHHWLEFNKGWLVTRDQQLQIHLIKPHTGTHLLLPSKRIANHLSKVILYRTPDCSSGYFAVGINKSAQGLVCAQHGAENWTPLSCNHIVDAVVYQGKIYAISWGYLYCYGLEGSSLRCEKRILIRDINYGRWWPKNLVEWRGKLLVLCTDQQPWGTQHNHAFIRVKLYKVNLRDHKRRWRCVTYLRGDALFMGTNHVYAVSTSGAENIHGNCIYYTYCGWEPMSPDQKIYPKCVFLAYNLWERTWAYRPAPNSETHQQPTVWLLPR